MQDVHPSSTLKLMTSSSGSSVTGGEDKGDNTSHAKKQKRIQVCKRVSWILWWILVFVGWLAVVAAFGYMRSYPVDPKNPEDWRNAQYVGSEYTAQKGYPALMIHAFGGILCFLVGIMQFQSIIRRKLMILHKIGGYMFAAFIIIGFIGGLYLIPYSSGGVPTKVGFTLLSLIWIATLFMAMWYVVLAKRNKFVRDIPIQHRIQRHREWMIRCFSAIFASVTLRLYLFLFTGLYFAGNPVNPDDIQGSMNKAQSEAYPAATWLSFVGNLIISEIYINMVVRNEKEKSIESSEELIKVKPLLNP